MLYNARRSSLPSNRRKGSYIRSRSRCSCRWRQRGTVVLLASLTVLPASRSARAQTDTWNGANATWDVAADWSNGVPTAGSNAENDTSGTITFASGMDFVNSFLNTAAGGFSLTGGTLTTTTFFKNTGTGTIALSNGTLNVGGDFLNTSSGAVNVSGGALNITGNFTNSVTGILTFSGGTTTVSGNFLSAGVTNVTGGVLSGSGASSSLKVDNTFLLQNATLINFTVKNSSSLQISKGTLTNLVLDGGLSLTNDYQLANIDDNVTFGTATPTTTPAARPPSP